VIGRCSSSGLSYVEGLGTDMSGRSLYLNLFFGEEVLYSSWYEQACAGASDVRRRQVDG
jgi:hypothetical protein